MIHKFGIRFGACALSISLICGFSLTSVSNAFAVVPHGYNSTDNNGNGDNLHQVIDPNQKQGTGKTEISEGHADIGPTLNTGEWAAQVHDDSKVPSVWRYLRDVVFRVNDKAKKKAPDSPDYAFLGAKAGEDVWVVPQTQQAGVIWLGWQTQEPKVIQSLDRGMTFKIKSVDGPGQATVYLQNGALGKPEVIWTTTKPFPQQSWIDVNQHTHANWVFTKPGVYAVNVEFSAKLVDGRQVSVPSVLRFAVGDATKAQDAFAIPEPGAKTAESANSAQPEVKNEAVQNAQSDAGVVIIWSIVGAIVLLLVIACIALFVLTNRAKRKAFDKELEGGA